MTLATHQTFAADGAEQRPSAADLNTIIDGVNALEAAATVIPAAVQQDISDAGAANLTTYYTAWTTTEASAGTLAAGSAPGQLKKIQLIVDVGDLTLTFNTDATIVFADAGDYALLMWDGAAWVPIELGNDADGATAPVYTPAS